MRLHGGKGGVVGLFEVTWEPKTLKFHVDKLHSAIVSLFFLTEGLRGRHVDDSWFGMKDRWVGVGHALYHVMPWARQSWVGFFSPPWFCLGLGNPILKCVDLCFLPYYLI